LILVGCETDFDVAFIRIVPASSQNWCGAVQPGQFRNPLANAEIAVAIGMKGGNADK
jgi:hypothetical protein